MLPSNYPVTPNQSVIDAVDCQRKCHRQLLDALLSSRMTVCLEQATQLASEAIFILATVEKRAVAATLLDFASAASQLAWV